MSEPVFIGPSGAGKSRVGKRVARLLGVPFWDTDKMVVADHGPIAAIFAEHGEDRFRTLERAAVEQALQRDGVVSLGGGAVLDPRTQADLAHRPVVYLTITPNAVADRLGDGKRPLVAGGVGDWIDLNAPRWAIYERLADLTLDTSLKADDELAQEVAAWVRSTH